MQKDSPHPLTELRVDGGAANNDLLMQFQADLLGVPVLRPKDTEITAKGAALLAGLKTGLYDEATMQASWQVDRILSLKCLPIFGSSILINGNKPSIER